MNPDRLSLEVFDLAYPPDLGKLRSKFRELTKRGKYRHPDVGGTADGFRYLIESYSLVKRAVESGWVSARTVIVENSFPRPKKPYVPTENIIKMREAYAKNPRKGKVKKSKGFFSIRLASVTSQMRD